MEYTLYKNRLTEDANDCIARPINLTTRHFDELLTLITGPGSILKKTETKAVIAAYWDNIQLFMAKGEEYHDDYVSVRFSIRGAFENDKERFDPEKHEVTVNINVNPDFKKVGEQIKLQYIDAELDLPRFDEVYDWVSDSTDSKLSADGAIEIKGDRLKIFSDLEGQGVFFINQDTSAEIKVNHLRVNEPKHLMFKAPELPAGKYRVEIRNTSRKGSTLRSNMALTEFTVD